MPDQPQLPGGMSLKEFLAPRPGEVSKALPSVPRPYSTDQGGWQGYVRAAGVGAAGAAPFAAPMAAIPGLGWGAAGATLAYGALGGVAEHAAEQFFPDQAYWAGPLAGAAISPWRRGAQMIGTGIYHTVRDHPIAAAITGYTGHSAGVPSYLADLSQHIYAKAITGLGIPLATGLVEGGRRVLRGDVRPLTEAYGGAAGAAANMLVDPIYNLLNPPPSPPPPPVAEAPIPVRPPEQLAPIPMPHGRTRLQLDPPER